MRKKKKADKQPEIRRYARIEVKRTGEKGWLIGSRIPYNGTRAELLINFSKVDNAWVMADSVRVLPDTPSVKLARSIFRIKRWVRTYLWKIFTFGNIFTVLAFIAFALSILASIKILFTL